MTVLEEAAKIVEGARQKDYGTPLENWTRTASLWSVILGHEVTPQQAVLCMIAVKIARECHRPKRDTRVDLAGYAAVLDEITTPEPKREFEDHYIVAGCSGGS